MHCLGDDSGGRGNCWCLQLHGHWLQHLFEWKQKGDRGQQTNETARPQQLSFPRRMYL
jgi:hypothetical protein